MESQAVGGCKLAGAVAWGGDVERGSRRWLLRGAGALAASGALLLAPEVARAHFPFPQIYRTGAPLPSGGSEPTCAEPLCHSGPPPSGEFSVAIDPPSYTPGSVHLVTVTLMHPGQQRWGFELQALDAAFARAGSFAAGAGTGVTDEPIFGRQYVHHVHVCTPHPNCLGPVPPQCEEPPIPDGTSWTFEWTAPAQPSGTVTFYAVANAANGVPPPPCGLSLADVIYAATVPVPLPEPKAPAAGLAGLAAALAAFRARGAALGGRMGRR